MKRVTRRQALIGTAMVVGAAAGGVGGRMLLRKRYAPTPYDDLIALVEDRDGAAQIGETLLAKLKDFEPVTLAADMRRRIAARPLPTVLTEDASKARLVEAGGWVLPETLGLICALAAKAAA
jgi:hypothetical protein